MPAPHPVRDGILAVAVGGVLALALLLGVRVTQGPLAADDPTIGATPVGPQASARDSCDRQTGGGGGPVEPDPTPGPEFPRQQHDLDNGRPVTVTSQGNAEVAYHRLAEFATVVEFPLRRLPGQARCLQHRCGCAHRQRRYQWGAGQDRVADRHGA